MKLTRELVALDQPLKQAEMADHQQHLEALRPECARLLGRTAATYAKANGIAPAAVDGERLIGILKRDNGAEYCAGLREVCDG